MFVIEAAFIFFKKMTDYRFAALLEVWEKYGY